MSVSAEYREFVLEQLARVVPVTSRSMFGGVGIYGNGLFFALMDDDTLYLKADGQTVPDFEAIGSTPFRPMPDAPPMKYYELPADIVEDADALRGWVENSIAVAARARTKKRK
jgi:DNA transformation protein